MKNGGLTPWSDTFKTSQSDGTTPYERRLGELCKGPDVPFAAMVECHPISRLHQFGKKVVPGIFFGHVLIAGES